ncbi:MAG: metal ABC transporter ATP-binding protein [Firmicutes bacterium]|nr:metal ABC transporter ATP-binding protein [Bacillota bacterium]
MYDIEIKNLSVNYDSVIALKDINLKVKHKEFLGIIGPNGGGKSTLLKVLLGLLKPSKGSISLNTNKPLGYVPQYSHFDSEFPIKVKDVILMGKLSQEMFFHRYSDKEMKKVREIMDAFGLLKYQNRQIGQLSGGQIQKVMIARALIMEPDILLLDEPTASLDSNAKSEIYKILKMINKEKTIIIVSHDLEVISSYIESVACLNKTLHYHGDNNELNKETLEKTYGCPVELIAHGSTPHRVLNRHKEEKND